ncbi:MULTISPECIES: EamA family transporter [unclassified Mycobacterium]|uniref:EamA family transporter n=1 Tax=Mycobacteriaceae TaxID=1762 RepID=UPI001A8D7315|nr:integral membrane protein [Mycobacterium sp. PO1]GFM26047.1 integral membrane protein [Mycobacterium sp. PO2]
MSYGVSDFVGGIASRRVAALRVVIVSYPVALVVLVAAAAPLGGTMSTAAVVWGLLSGVGQAFGVWWFYAALGSGPISVVSPLTAILVAGLPVGVGLTLGERPSALAGVGVVLALIAVVLVSREASDEPLARREFGPDEPLARREFGPDEPLARREFGPDEPLARREFGPDEDARPHRFTMKVAWLTVGAGVAFGMNFVILDQIPVEANLWPLVLGRVAATVVVLVAALATANLARIRGVPLRLALLAGVLDAVATVTSLLALQASLLSLAGVLIALYPAATVLLAIVVLRERVTSWQAIGMVLALLAVALITAG